MTSSAETVFSAEPKIRTGVLISGEIPRFFRTSVLISGAILAFGTVAAHADSCDELSYRRNAIYKNGGYCFKTAAQIRNFGNAGCQFDNQADVPLSQNDRAEVAAIIREERAYGCR